MKLSKTVAVILIIVIAIFFIGVGILVGRYVSSNNAAQNSIASTSPYSAVYLSTGDVYFGILDWSPSPHIENPWFLQRGTNAQGQATVGVYPFSQVSWGPSDAVYFNAQDIVFWTRLSSTSSVVEAMEDPSSGVIQENLPSSQQVSNAPSGTASSTATSTTKL